MDDLAIHRLPHHVPTPEVVDRPSLRGRLYGAVPTPELAGRRFAEETAAAEPEPDAGRPEPGQLRRRKQHVLVRPMPRRIA